MSEFLVDTVAFVRDLEDQLSAKADRIFREAESGTHHLLLPQIALAEFIYVALRGRLKGARPAIQVRDVLHNLFASDAFTVSGMPAEGWELMPELPIPELHDRMIAAEALARDVPLISNDASFDAIGSLTRIW